MTLAPGRSPHPPADAPLAVSTNANRSGGVTVVLAITLIGAAIYASTLMFTVSGSDSAYTVDTGEFQVALSESGTVHHTGYPLYMLLGSPFVNALRLAGVPPSAGASIFSLAWEVLAVGGAGLIVLRLTGRRWLAFAIGLTLALVRSVWIHAVVAEVYSMSLAITVAILWVTLDLMEAWDERKGWLLALLAGIGVAHHRLIAVGLPVVGLMLLPSLAGVRPGVRLIRWLLLAAFFFALGFLPYLDMPLRAWRGATWVYGRPDTWSGFWYLFLGTEVAGWQKPVLELARLLPNGRDTLVVLATELTWPGLIAAAAGTGLAVTYRRTRRAGVLLAGIALSYTAFAVLVREAVLLEADLMTVSLCLLIGSSLGLASWLSRSPRNPAEVGASSVRYSTRTTQHAIRATSSLSLGLLLIWPLALFLLNRPFILSISRDPAGVNYIRQVARLEAPPGSIVMAPWGWRYFALAYAQRVEGQMADWIIVDHRADFTGLTRLTGRAYTAADSFYIFTADGFWAPRLGGAHLSSAGPGLVQISAAPDARPPSAPLVELGDGLAFAGIDVRPPDADGNSDIVLWWAATAKPARDYSTFVHVSDRDQIDSADDLIAQSDQVAPVYAWYPTTKWTPGEVVREDHVVPLPLDRPAKLIAAGMYYRDEAGAFVILGTVEVRREGDKWTRQSRVAQ